MTTVWLCEPRSHGRNKEATPLPGRPRQRRRTPSIGVSGFVPVWARSILSSSCVVIRSLAGPCASPPSGGHGCPCARPLEAATGRRRGLWKQNFKRLTFHGPILKLTSSEEQSDYLKKRTHIAIRKKHRTKSRPLNEILGGIFAPSSACAGGAARV